VQKHIVEHLVSGVSDAATGDPKLVIVLVGATDGSTGIIRGDSSPFILKRSVILGLGSRSQSSEAETTDACHHQARGLSQIHMVQTFKFGY